MATNDYKKLNTNVTEVYNHQLTNQLETNLKTYLDWGLLEVGGFNNVTSVSSGAYGGSFDTLRPVDDEAYVDGQVWETARKDWVWETGLTYSESPITISGVYIASTLYTTGDATYAHHYNYPLGRVVFDTAISTASVVELNYSYRDVQVYVADDVSWWDELQYDSMRIDDDTFDDFGSGNWQILSNHRVQMPAVIIEAAARRSFKPYEMGTVGNYVYQDVLFHIVSQNRWWRNQLMDIISLEKDRTIWLYDFNSIETVTGWPLDYEGMTLANPNMYPTLVDTYPFKKARFYNVSVTELDSIHTNLHRGTVRVTFEIVMA